MQAITTTYRGATNTKPSKIVAKSASGLRVSVSYEHEYTADDNHKRAALSLCKKHGWPNELVGGGLSDDSEVWVMIPIHQRLVDADILTDSAKWLGKLIADGGHQNSVMPNHAVNTLQRVQAAIERKVTL